MMDWYQVISYLLTNELRLLLGLYLVAKLLDFLPELKALLLSACGGAIVTILQVVSVPTIGIMAVEILVISIVAWYYRREQLRRCLFLIFFYEVGIGLWDFLLSAGFGILFHSELFINANAPEHLIAIWLVRLLMLVVARLLVAQHKKSIGNMRLVSTIVILGMLGAITISEQTILPLSEDQIGSWIILSMVLMFAIMFYRVNRQREMELEIVRLKQEQAEMLERDYQTLSRTYSDNAKLYHDLHNHIEAIYQCLAQGDIPEAIRYCEDLRAPVREISQTIWTGNKATDYLISSKLALAEQEHIKTKVNIEYPRKTNIRSVDLTTILGNLLDNALEAAKTAPDKLRFLTLTVRRINSMLIIKVENGYGEIPTQENGKLMTSKADKAFHGLGLKSIQTTAELYDGTINTEYEGGVFKAVVTLSFQSIKTE